MSDKFTIARPYALAVFDQARQENALSLWSQMLTYAVQILRNPTMSGLLGCPLLSRTQMAELFIAAVNGEFSASGCNLLRLLSMNDRLEVLPEIAVLFDKHKTEFEGCIRVICAYPLSAEQEQFLIQALAKRLGRTINITVQVDPDIIGGAIIHIGDVVIDGSLRAGLTQMAVELHH